MVDDADQARRDDAWRTVMRREPPPVTDPYTQFTAELFDRLWGRPGLGRRERRLVSLTAVALSGQRDPLVFHLAASLDSGDLTAEELHEWVVHVAHYGGWPIGALAYGALREVEAGRA
ncbi:MAG TPA: carboxymuconolactone decarboxylase family protein [Acidimicrobiia bacterium]|nr:carboxymuconolactone decarboxylase family protein [Acidimicrobiia bacterium]